MPAFDIYVYSRRAEDWQLERVCAPTSCWTRSGWVCGLAHAGYDTAA